MFNEICIKCKIYVEFTLFHFIMSIDPIKLCVKFDPPMLAMFYQNKGRRYIHEIPILYDDLEFSSDEIFEIIMEVHAKYLKAVEPEQVKTLIEKIQEFYSLEQERDFDFLEQRLRDLDDEDLDDIRLSDLDIDFEEEEDEMF